MRKGLRVAWLLAAYGAIAYGGEQAYGLLAQDVPASARRVPHDAGCSFESERELSLPASAEGTLDVRSGAGALRVEGRDGLDEVVVVGLLCASSQETLDALAVRAEQGSDGDVLVDTHYPDRRDADWQEHRVARIDLTVRVPLGMTVRIDDSSGDLIVSGTGDLRIDDSSGSVEVFDVLGDVEIEDGSGGVEVASVSGSLELRDGSGGIDVARVEGDVRVRDGSGGIDVRDVGGDFVVESDGSGGVRHSGVEGRVDVPEKKRRRRR